MKWDALIRSYYEQLYRSNDRQPILDEIALLKKQQETGKTREEILAERAA